jgi:long-chain acyl-CoA synthetase
LRRDTIPARLLDQANLRPDAPAYHVRAGGRWHMTDWATYVQQVRQAGKALIALGVERGDHVAIVGTNRPEWVVFHLGALCVGGASAGVYPGYSADELGHIVAHADAIIVLIEGRSRTGALFAERLPRLRHIVTLDRVADVRAPGAPNVMDWEQFQAHGDEVPDRALDDRIDRLEPDALAALIYTPGTEGRPKGVMLSHDNLAWTAAAIGDFLGSGPRDTALSYLPLAHILEQLIAVYVPITVGSSVYFAPSLDTVAENLREVQPTLAFGPPRVWERFHAGVSAHLASARGANQSVVAWVQRVARAVCQLRNQGRRPGWTTWFKYRFARHLLLARLASALGLANARVCASSTAPMADDLLEFFCSLDVAVHELYGQAETCGIASANRPGATRFGTAGLPVAGVEIEITRDSEILVRGPNVFMGYYKDEEATRAALPGGGPDGPGGPGGGPGSGPGGWLHTGDLGRIDSQGFLTVIGRKHEIITAGRARIAPQPIEAALESSPLIQAAALLGHGRAHVAALITLDPDAVAEFLASRGLAPGPVDEIPELRDAVQAEIDRVNSLLAEDETIEKFTILRRGFTVESGELTPMFTLRRAAIRDNHAAAITAMYEEPS